VHGSRADVIWTDCSRSLKIKYRHPGNIYECVSVHGEAKQIGEYYSV